MKSITKTFEFSASHRLYQPAWSEEENLKQFGKCCNPHGHGHNYKLEVMVSGEINPQTGMILDASVLDKIVSEQVIVDLDHKNLNLQVSWLEGKIPSTENLVDEIWDRLFPNITTKAFNGKLHKLRLWETSRIYAEREE